MNGLLIKAMQLKNADELSVAIEQGLAASDNKEQDYGE
jgi:hypothetical protein